MEEYDVSRASQAHFTVITVLTETFANSYIHRTSVENGGGRQAQLGVHEDVQGLAQGLHSLTQNAVPTVRDCLGLVSQRLF